MQAATFLGDSLSELHVRLVERREAARYQAQMARHHYLGELPKIGVGMGTSLIEIHLRGLKRL